MEEFETSLNSDLKINSIYFILRTTFILFALFSLDIILYQYIADFLNRDQLGTVLTAIEILWIILSAVLINLFLSNIIYVFFELKKGRIYPNLIKSLSYFFVYIIAFIIIYQSILHFNLTSLLASMGVLTMVIGFAIQSNLSNIFSGIALNLEKTISINDWVKVTGYDEGRVKDINWRTTTLLCRDGKIIHIPNSIIAEQPLLNYSKSNALMRILIIDINLKYDSKVVTKILFDSTRNINNIVDVPVARTAIAEIDKWSVKYKVLYYINNYSQRYIIAENVWSNVLKNLSNAGIEPSIKKEEVMLQIMNQDNKTQTEENLS